MQDRVFLDTNILIYIYSEDEQEKQALAISLLERYSKKNIISIQVINELINILFKKFKIPSDTIETAILEIDNLVHIVEFKLTTQIKAIKIKEKYKLQYYDSLIVATAIENGCTILFSEDMQNGQIIDDVLKIVNPFRHLGEKC